MTTSAMVATVARTTRYAFIARPYADRGETSSTSNRV
jgi:hypothetical protein